MKSTRTLNPFTLEEIKQYDFESDTSIDNKINKATQIFDQWRQLSVAERVTILEKACHYFESHQDDIARSLSEHMGKPLKQSYGEISGLFQRARYLLSIAEETLAPDELGTKEGVRLSIHHEPLGTVFVNAAWNYPLMIALNGVLTALLAGNAVLLKHSSVTLNIGDYFEKAFGHIPGYEGLLQHVVIDHATTSQIIENKKVHHVIFTGSVSGGRTIYQNVAQATNTGFIDCHLELGGKDGAYVAADADVKAAATGLVDGAMYNAGQSCCGIERAYVHEDVYEDFIKYCEEEIDNYILGDPFDDNVSMGPLSRAKAATDMTEQIEEAKSQGATVNRGGQIKIIDKATFFEPTLLTHVTQNMKVMREENFGPILPVIKVSNDEEALQLVNDCNLGLTSAIFTSSLERAESFAKQAQTGTVYLNRCDYLDPALPWTGMKNSGKGSALSKYAFYALTRRKALNFRLPT